MTSQTNPQTTPTISAPLKDASQSRSDAQEGPKSRLEKLLSPFRRVTSNGQYIPVIDGLRFVAIMMVVMYHLNDYIVHKKGLIDDPEVRSSSAFQIFNAGNVGVQLFFAISGFILALPFIAKVQQGKPLGLKKYFLRRLTRLEPPYIINLTIVLLLLIFWKGQSFSDLIGPYFASLFYVHNIVYGEMSRVNGVAWSLEIEVQFYCLAPLLFTCLFRALPILRRAILIALILTNSTNALDLVSLSIGRTLLSEIHFFLAGVLCADLYSSGEASKPGTYLSDAISLASIIALHFSHDTGTIDPTASIIAILVFSSINGKLSQKVLSLTPIATIGGMCYSIYLYHFFIISAISPLSQDPRHTNYPIYITILAITVCLTCSIPFLLFERPFMLFRSQLTSPISTHTRALKAKQ